MDLYYQVPKDKPVVEDYKQFMWKVEMDER